MNTISNQYTLPNDVWNRILSELPNKERILCSRVCKLFQQINNSLPSHFWQNWATEILPENAVVETKDLLHWKKMVIDRCRIEKSYKNFNSSLIQLKSDIGKSTFAKDLWLLGGYLANVKNIIHSIKEKIYADDEFLGFSVNEFKKDSCSLEKTVCFDKDLSWRTRPEAIFKKTCVTDDDNEHSGYAAWVGNLAAAQNYFGDYLKGKRNRSFDEDVDGPNSRTSELEAGKSKETLDKCAFESYEKAAQQDYPPALYNLGKCYEFGFGCIQDHSKAFKSYLKGAKLGHAKALYRLGKCYEMGIGCTINLSTALKCYMVAATSDQLSNYHAGYCFEHGIGCQKDPVKAQEFYRKTYRLPRPTNKLMEYRRRISESSLDAATQEPALKKARHD